MSNDPRPTIVLVPGFMTDRDLWTDLIPELDGFNTVCADISSGSSLEAIAAQVTGAVPAPIHPPRILHGRLCRALHGLSGEYKD